MNKKKPFPRWLITIIVICAFFALNIILTVLRNISSPVAQNETATETATDEKDLEEIPIQKKIKDKIDSLNIKYSDLEIYQDDTDQFIISYQVDDSFWNENDFLIDCISNYVKICSGFYENDEANRIELKVYCNLTDARGNETKEKGFNMCMLKDNYKKYNWENLEYSPIDFDLLRSDCEELYVHPGIKKNINFDKLYYR